MRRIKVRLKERSYYIVIGKGLLKDCASKFKKAGLGKDAVIITNKRLAGLYGKILENALSSEGITSHFELVPDSEKAKSTRIAARLINNIGIYDRNKDIFIIAFGGGVIGDLAGFVASIYKRGIPYVQIPTTLLAQVDSAIGGKVAVDLPVAKNLVGTFYQPRIVLSDPSILKTLSLRQIKNGIAELIKYGVIRNSGLFEYLEKNYRMILGRNEKALEYCISKASAIKAAIVADDEFDKKRIRMVLNFGHTLGHAIEAASGYSGRYNHGEAIAIGMLIASSISLRLGIMRSDRDARRIEALIKKCALPAKIRGLKFSDIYESHLRDKKSFRGKNRFVLPVRIGKVRIVDGVPDPVIKDVLKTYLNGA